MCKPVKFTYTYRSSDGERHAAEIEAESRDAAFAKVRTELGIKPIKVVAAGDHAAGEGSGKSAASPRWGVVPVIALIAAILLIALVAWWWFGGRGATTPAQEPAAYTVNMPQGPVTMRVAEPLPRQAIPGNRQRIEEAVNGPATRSMSGATENRQDGRSTCGIFQHPAEAYLARFAEPGRISFIAINEMNGGKPHARPSEAEFAACLKEPIRIASTDFTEVVDLKRIVTGMKREMQAYLAGGGTVEGYLVELEKRQRLEISYRDNAERRLNDMLNGQDARSPSATGGTPVVPDAAKMAAPHAGGTHVSGQDARSRSGRDSLKTAYAYWLKANAQLQAMGIYPLALPDVLRSYQMSLDIEE